MMTRYQAYPGGVLLFSRRVRPQQKLRQDLFCSRVSISLDGDVVYGCYSHFEMPVNVASAKIS